MYRQLGIRLDYDEAEKLFFRRLDDPTLNISRGFEANFDEPTTDQARRIKSAIDEHRSRMAGKIEKDLFTQKTRLVTAERSLKTKETKKSREDVRIATNKIASLTEKLSDLRRSEPKARDNRIFPTVYAGVIVNKMERISSGRCAMPVVPPGSRLSMIRSFRGYITPGATISRSFGTSNSVITMP